MLDCPHPLRHAIVAVIENGDRILMVERAATDTYPGYWSAVTGGLDGDESQEQACVREVGEEVGLKVRPVRKLWESLTRGGHFVLHWWQCELVGSDNVTPEPSEVSDWRWVKPADLHTVPLMFSDSRWFYAEIYPHARQA